MKVIFLTPMYNCSDILDAWTKYILQLDPKPDKIIFCENNSDDNTLERLIDFPYPHEVIRFYTREPREIPFEQAYDIIAHARQLLLTRARQIDPDYCFKPKTLVETDKGFKKIKNVITGDIVKTHKGNFKKVVKIYKRELRQRKSILWIRSKNSIIKCTPDHPFYIEQGVKKFVRARNLKVGDKLLYPCNLHDDYLTFNIRYNKLNGGRRKNSIRYGLIIKDLKMNIEIARFLGLYLAEGSLRRDGIALTFNNYEKELIDFVKFIVKKYFKRKCNVNIRWATNITIGIKALSSLFREWFGSYAYEKKIPNFVYGWNLKNRLSFIKGYLEGDGCLQNGTYSFVSASLNLVKGMNKLFKDCGLETSKIITIKPNVSLYKNNKIQNKGSYVSWLKSSSWRKMFDLLEADYFDGYLRINIKKIEKHKQTTAKDMNVYNLEVEEDNSYIALFASVHNCIFIDSDILIKSEDLITSLTDWGVDVVGGAYLRWFPEGLHVASLWKVGYYKPWRLYTPKGFKQLNKAIQEVYATSGGCLCLSRKVIQDRRADFYPVPKGFSEDFGYCEQLRNVGYKIWLDGITILTHRIRGKWKSWNLRREKEETRIVYDKKK